MTLFQAIRTVERPQILRETLLLVLATALLAISAKISIPFYPVPFTMQTFVVVGLGLTLGSVRGAAAILLYLAEGAVGIPVFSGTPQAGIGVAYMFGSTGGYLVGFVLAAYAAGWCAERGWDRNVFSTFAITVGASAVIFIPGVLWLGVLFGWDKPIVAWGLVPFIWGGLLKAGLAAVIFPVVGRYLKSWGIIR